MWPITKSALAAFVKVTPSNATVGNTERNINGALCSIETSHWMVRWSISNNSYINGLLILKSALIIIIIIVGRVAQSV